MKSSNLHPLFGVSIVFSYQFSRLRYFIACACVLAIAVDTNPLRRVPSTSSATTQCAIILLGTHLECHVDDGVLFAGRNDGAQNNTKLYTALDSTDGAI